MTTLFNPIMDNLWKPSLWVNGILTDTDSPSINLYNFYLSLPSLTDSVSSTVLQTTNDSGRYNYAGTEFAADVPVIEVDGSLLTCGAYTVLNGKSNDISDAYWSTASADRDVYNEFKATARYGYLQRNISTTAGSLYTLSFYAYVEEGGNLGNYSFRHNGSADGNTTPIPGGLSHARKRYSFTVLGEGSSLTVSFGFQDLNFSNWSKVYIDTINITESTILYPPAINTTTAARSVPPNYADATHGSKIPINSTDTPQLLDALDGIADGDELTINGDFSAWTSGRPDDFTVAGVDVNNYVEENLNGMRIVSDNTLLLSIKHFYAVTAGSKVLLNLPISDVIEGSIRYRVRDETNSTDIIPADNVIEVYNKRIDIPATCSSVSVSVFRDTAGATDYVINSWSLKEISPAEGELVVEWMPMFDWDDVSVIGYILCCLDNTKFLYTGTTGNIIFRDVASIATAVSVNWQANTPYTLTAQYGPHPGYGDALKMQLTVTDGTTTWTSAVADFDGSFDPGDYLSFGWDNEYPQDIKLVSFAKEPGWGT